MIRFKKVYADGVEYFFNSEFKDNIDLVKILDKFDYILSTRSFYIEAYDDPDFKTGEELLEEKRINDLREKSKRLERIYTAYDKSFFGSFESALKNGYFFQGKSYVIIDYAFFHELLKQEREDKN